MYLYTCTCMSNIGKAEKCRGILYILQCKKKNRKTLMNMYDKIHYIIFKNYDYLEDKINKSL